LRLFVSLALAAASLFLPNPGFAEAPLPIGVAPEIARVNTNFPNSDAVVEAWFVPGLAEGFVPQGLARFGRDILLSGYMADSSGCRVYRMSFDFSVKEQIDIPVRCLHAGGIAVSPKNEIVVADNRQLIVWPADHGSIEARQAEFRTIRLTSGLKGTFLTGTANGLILGSFYPDVGKTVGQTMSWSALHRQVIAVSDIQARQQFLPRTQGMAKLDDGSMITASQGNPNLISVWSSDGALVASFPFLRGIQGVVANSDGTMLTVSESGSAPYRNRSDIYPALMKVKISALSLR
jgi:hypothetical protein